MIVTQNDARKLIARYHPDVKPRLTCKLTVVSLPIWEHRAGKLALCWQKIDSGKASAVRIGVMRPDLTPDWGWQGETP